jgi:hypothetical protein
MDALADLVRRGAGSNEGRLETRCPRFQRQHDFADVAGDDDVNLVFVDRALERANRIRRGRMVIIGDDLDLASIDAALGIDFVSRHLGCLRDRRTGDGLRFCNDTYLDRLRCKRRTGSGRQKAERGSSKQAAQ